MRSRIRQQLEKQVLFSAVTALIITLKTREVCAKSLANKLKQLRKIELLSCPGLSIKPLQSHFLKPQMIYDTRNDRPAKVFNKGKKGTKYMGFQQDDDRQNAVVDKWDLHNGEYSTLPVSCEFNVGTSSLALVLEDFSSPSWRWKASVWPSVS